jgi:fructokinase
LARITKRDGSSVVCFGEALVDLVAAQRGALSTVPTFHRMLGGAPANVAFGLARLGVRAAFAGAVGDDAFGGFLLARLARVGVDVSACERYAARPTGLSFVAIDCHGERSFAGYGAPTADRFFVGGERFLDLVGRSRVFHFGSNVLMERAARDATERALHVAQKAGVRVTFDPNLRLHLWPSAREMVDAVMEFAGLSDVVKVSADELALLPGLAARAPVIVVTEGAKGAVAMSGAGDVFRAARAIRPVDTTGAGDAFMAGFLASYVDAPNALGAALAQGNRVARRCCAHLGATGGATRVRATRTPSR